MIECLRICAHCNKEYKLPLKTAGNATTDLLHNFSNCPHCGVRDDVWILIRLDNLQAKR